MKLEMQALETIAKTREYLDYVEDHINNVSRAWEEVMAATQGNGDFPINYDDYRYHTLCGEVAAHDLSKLSPEEFVQYRLMFYPTEAEKKESTPQGFDEAWKHHWKNNHHHWEKWTTTNYYGPYEEEIHCTHMVIDWLAMSYRFGDTPREYYEKNKDKIELPEWAVKYIYQLFDSLEENKKL